MNADNILFHPHYTGELMTEPQKGKTGLGETCKKRLVKVFVSEKYGREDELDNKYIKKGLQVEEDAITLYSRIKKTVYFKNEQTIQNEYLIGTPDFGDKKIITQSETIIDTKCSWDLFTFWASKTVGLKKDYYWQMQSYFALTGAKRGVIAHCLINTPPALIYDEKRKLQWKMGVINPDNDKLYQQACDELDKAMTYDDIPMKERMFEIIVERNDADIERLYERVKQCRKYMNDHFFCDLDLQLQESIKKEAA